MSRPWFHDSTITFSFGQMRRERRRTALTNPSYSDMGASVARVVCSQINSYAPDGRKGTNVARPFAAWGPGRRADVGGTRSSRTENARARVRGAVPARERRA